MEIVSPIIARQQAAVDEWEAARVAARERLTELAWSVLIQGKLTRTQPKQLAAFCLWMSTDEFRDLSQENGVSRELWDKWLQRARVLLRKHGACEEDLAFWTKGAKQSKPRVQGAQAILAELVGEEAQ